MIDIFLSGGCSFSETPLREAENWPLHVERYLKIPSIHTGLATAGNYYIYKSLMYQLSKIKDKENLLVGIMWSCADRQMFYNRRDLYLPAEKKSIDRKIAKRFDSPIKIAGEHAHYFTRPGTDYLYNTYYHKYIYDEIGSYIQTTEYVLQMQWYLKLHKIKYFMTCISGWCIPDNEQTIKHPDISYLYEQIDFSNWLNVKNMMDFNRDSGLPTVAPNNLHPSTEQSKLFTEQIIIPHLKSKGYIN